MSSVKSLATIKVVSLRLTEHSLQNLIVPRKQPHDIPAGTRNMQEETQLALEILLLRFLGKDGEMQKIQRPSIIAFHSDLNTRLIS